VPSLAINTSANFVSLALLDGKNVLLELDSRSDFQLEGSKSANQGAVATSVPAGANDQLPAGYTKKRSKRGQATRRVFPPGASVMLAPMLQQMFKQHQLQAGDLDLICLCNGPGMFTGLRPEATDSNLHVAINAQRQQLFTAQFRHLVPWRIEKLVSDQIVDQSQFVEGLGTDDWVTGAGLKPITETIAAAEPEVRIVPPESWELSAASVGQVGSAMYAAGHRDDFWKVEPLYFRPSAAEEVRLQKALDGGLH